MEGYDYTVDIWSLGCCLYEIVVGEPPFRDPYEAQTQELRHKEYFSSNLKNLLNGLLVKNPAKRFTLQDAKSHPFFKGINWEKILDQSAKAPINVKVKTDFDIRNIDKQIL